MPRHQSGSNQDGNGETNQPLAKVNPEHKKVRTHRVFQIAEANFSEKEILGLLESWINEDKLGDLSYILEQQGSSLAEIADAPEPNTIIDLSSSTNSISCSSPL